MVNKESMFSKMLRPSATHSSSSIDTTLEIHESVQKAAHSTPSLAPVDCQCDECKSYIPPTPLRKEETIADNGDYFSLKDDQFRVLSDVLPTFQLDSWIVNRNLNHASTSDELPTYNEVSAQRALSSPPTILPNEQQPDHPHTPEESSANANANANLNGVNTNDRVMNNLNHLTRVDAPLHIAITLTREYPEMNKVMLKVNQLREYHPGDVITGSIIVENKSQKPIPFSMILVTLEGTMTIPTKGSIMRRSFLKMVDFGACYHYGYFPTTNVKTPLVQAIDNLDGTEYGFSDSMIIEPGSKHKKFFYFKLPERLLDSICDHQIISHFDTLPPSFGLDQSCFNGQGKDITVNELLGYGRCLMPGSPILLNDQSERDQSISYSINVSIIGKDTKRESLFSSSLRKKEDFKYCMLQEKQHFIRFAPGEDITAPPPISSDLYKHPSTLKQLEKLERLSKDTIKKLIQTKELKQIGVKDERELLELTTDAADLADYNVVANNHGQNAKKETQLRLNTRPNEILSENGSRTDKDDIVETEASITLKQKKKAFSAFSSNNKLPEDLGLLTVKSSINKNSKIPYLLPSALKKIADKPPISRSDSGCNDDSSNRLVPFASPSVELYPVESMSSIVSSTSNLIINDLNADLNTVLVTAQPFLDKITLQLIFRPSTNQVKPPDFQSIKPILRSVTMASPYPIPVTFDRNSFISETNENGSHELNQIKSKFSSYLTEIRTLSKESGRGMDRQLFFDLLSITNMTKSEKNLSIFKAVNVTKQPVWKSYMVGGDSKLIYKSELSFALVVDKVAAKTLTVLPNFDSCFFTRRYYLSVGFGLKKASTGGNMLSIPVDVGQYIQSTAANDYGGVIN